MAVRDWVVQKPDEGAAELLEKAGFSGILSRLLSNRGIKNAAQAQNFLDGAQELFDPWLLQGMAQAVARIQAAIQSKEKIIIYGDYDVDGVTATALLLTCLQSLGAQADYYIPSRESEGYGLNAGAVEALCKAGAKLIVTVDTGISAFDEAELAMSLGADLIITDHHQPRPALPAAHAVINPKQGGDEYPCRELAGVGVAFKLACALEGDSDAAFEKYGALVTLGTVADVVPLTGENRAIVKRGLALMQRSQSCGVKCLLEAAGVKAAAFSAGLLSFTAAPRINAAGRMGSAGDALRLLTAQDEETAAVYAKQLDGQNRQRQEIESRIFTEAVEKISASGLCDPVLMVCGEGWHSGVIGIVASRLAERYGKPAIVVSFEGQTGRASCRSFPGLDIHDALMHAADLLERFGGHALAAGFTVKRENYDALYEAMQSYARALKALPVPVLCLEYELPEGDITLVAARQCKKLEPCGCGNPEPMFYIKAAQVVSVAPLKEGRHLRLEMNKNGKAFKAMLFNADKAGLHIEAGELLDLAASLDVNPYNGSEYLSVIVRDARTSCIFDEGRRLYQGLLTAAAPERSQADILPGREDFAAVYRFLRESKSGSAAYQKVLAQLSGPQNGAEFAKLLLILDVFSEMKLVTISVMSGIKDEFTFEINKEIKIDLKQSKLLRQLSGVC